MGQEICETGGDWGYRDFQQIRYVTQSGVPFAKVRIMQCNHNRDLYPLGKQVEEVTKAYDAIVTFSREYAHEVNGAIEKIRKALDTPIEIQANADGVLNEGRGLWKIVDHNHQQNEQHFRKFYQHLMAFHTSLKQSCDGLEELASNVDKQMETITSRVHQIEQELKSYMTHTNSVLQSHDERI